MSIKLIVTLCFAIGIPACAQTSNGLAAKYPVVVGYEVRPGILMTARYAEDGNVCEMILEKRHYHTRDQIDLSSVIPKKLEDQLIDELAPPAERGQPTSRWLDKDSYVAGGVTHTKRDFENVSVEMDGSVSEGDEIVVIRWKNRACAAQR